MNVQSKPGQGSRFEAWLPATSPSAATVAGPPTLPLGHGETVLIVESERERLLRDEETLAALGYEPVGFSLPDDAVAACRAAPDRFDAVVVEPGCGPQACTCRSLRRDRPLKIQRKNSGSGNKCLRAIGTTTRISPGIGFVLPTHSPSPRSTAQVD